MARREQNPELAHFTLDELIEEAAARCESMLVVYEQAHKTDNELIRGETDGK